MIIFFTKTGLIRVHPTSDPGSRVVFAKYFKIFMHEHYKKLNLLLIYFHIKTC